MSIKPSDKKVSTNGQVIDLKKNPELKAVIDFVETINSNLVTTGCDTVVNWGGFGRDISIDGKTKKGTKNYITVSELGGGKLYLSTSAMDSPSIITSLYEKIRHGASWGEVCAKDFNNVSCVRALDIVGQFIKSNCDNPYHQKAVNDAVDAAKASMTVSSAGPLNMRARDMLDPSLRN